MEHRAEGEPEKATSLRGIAARPVLQTDVHHAAQEQANQMEIGKIVAFCDDDIWWEPSALTRSSDSR